MMTSYHFYYVLIISLVTVTADPVPEFQFPCYVDVCTFPRQYCNSDRNERRCSPCTRNLCKKEDLPRACVYYCQIADKPVTTVTNSFPRKQNVVESNWRDKSEVYTVYMMIFIAVTNTIVLAVVLFTAIWLLRFCASKKPPLTPMQRFLSEPGDRDIEMALLQDRRAQGHREMVLSTGESEQDSTKSLPPYTSKETQVVDMLRDSSKSTNSSSDLDQQADSDNDSKRNSPVNIDKSIQVEARQSSNKTHLCKPYVSSPTGDKQHEYHEKPWRLVGTTERVESVESVLRNERNTEQTCLKHSI